MGTHSSISPSPDDLESLEGADNSVDGPLEGRRYQSCFIDGIEDLEDYCEGGFHPVFLGDELEGRYRVVHKLGAGGLATVWLCRDREMEKYVAVKIIAADQSREDCADLKMTKLEGCDGLGLPQHQFWVDGPNGRHLCLVLPVFGPRVDQAWDLFESPERSLRNIALHATKGLHALHSNGLGHGDFRPANILLQISSLDHLNEEELIHALGKPESFEVYTKSGEEPEPAAPKYVVAPIAWDRNVDRKYFKDQIAVVDFGESFETSNPPKELGTPTAYCAPELLIGSIVSQASDLWALACTLSEIRTTRRLFRDWEGDGEDPKWQMVVLLGKFPEPWWSSWETRKNYFDDNGDPYMTESGHMSVSGARTIEEYVEEGVTHDLNGVITKSHTIPRDEGRVLADLLGQMLKYDPRERISTATVLEHPWFKM
ncbi:kinase-like protein [Lophium mytilinum]|uniref:EKC/KEOPS complex subunit BUD32 n=1 Tax=Lophium mytilinum TaxID=390894 RepID=A0A6A6QD49_9PEZI|nr:kinase-like protein [Lophium mytilinum]